MRTTLFCSAIGVAAVFLSMPLLADEQTVSIQDALKIAEQYQRKFGHAPSLMNVTVTSDVRQLKDLSASDLEVLTGVTKERRYWIVHHSVDSKRTPGIRGQTVYVVIDARTRDVIFTLVK